MSGQGQDARRWAQPLRASLRWESPAGRKEKTPTSNLPTILFRTESATHRWSLAPLRPSSWVEERRSLRRDADFARIDLLGREAHLVHARLVVVRQADGVHDVLAMFLLQLLHHGLPLAELLDVVLALALGVRHGACWQNSRIASRFVN